MDCVSFTLLMLLFSFLSLFGLATVVIESVFILFLMTTCIAVIIFFTDKLPINSTPVSMIVDLSVVIAVVFVIGALTGFIPFEAPYVAVVLGMIAVVYFGTFGVLIIKARADAEDINRQIKKMKQERE
mgnify:CR=1 FL=1